MKLIDWVSIFIVVLIVVAYFFKLKKEKRGEFRYVLWLLTGFTAGYFPKLLSFSSTVIMVTNIFSCIIVGIGLVFYFQKRKADRKKRGTGG